MDKLRYFAFVNHLSPKTMNKITFDALLGLQNLHLPSKHTSCRVGIVSCRERGKSKAR